MLASYIVGRGSPVTGNLISGCDTGAKNHSTGLPRARRAERLALWLLRSRKRLCGETHISRSAPEKEEEVEVVLSPKLLEAMERRMQFCGTCGVGIGLMTKAEYADLYACPFCGGKLRPALEREERSLFPPETQQYLTPHLFYSVLCEVFAERRNT